MLSPANKSAGIMFTDGESILLLKRSGEDTDSGTWDLPGGHSKSGETPLENAHREAIEEMGLKDIPGTKFNQIDKLQNGKQYTLFLYKVDKKFKPKLNKEHTNFEWVKFQNLKNKKIFSKLIQDIPECLKMIKKITSNFSEWINLKQILN